MSSKSTHVKNINVTIPVEQLQYKHGDEDPKQFFPDEYGFIYSGKMFGGHWVS